MHRRILFLTHRVPFPPNRGDRIRSYHVLKFLSARAEVDLACLADEPVPEASRRELESLCRRIAVVPLVSWLRWFKALVSVTRGRSATEGLFSSKEFADTLQRWTKDTQYDLVLAYCSSMATYLHAGHLKRLPCVVDLVDVDSQKWFDYAQQVRGPARWLFHLEGRRVQSLEQRAAERARAIVVVSSTESELFRAVCPHSSAYPILNGVDLDYFSPREPIVRENSGALECTFVGALDYRANVDAATWFCHAVWPRVRVRCPKARFVLVGRRPDPQIRRLSKEPGVELIGEVPDVRPYLERARLIVAPLRVARGIQNKVLEAMAAGKAVVASPQALEGLDVVPETHVYQAHTPAEWIAAIGRLLYDEDECGRLGKAARAFVCERHRWERCLQPLENLLWPATETTVPSALTV